MNEQEERRASELGQQARQVIDSPAFDEAWKLLTDEIHRAWLDCSVRDVEKQKLLLQQAKLVDRLRSKLSLLIEGGRAVDALKERRQILPEVEDLGDEGLLRRGMRAAQGWRQR